MPEKLEPPKEFEKLEDDNKRKEKEEEHGKWFRRLGKFGSGVSKMFDKACEGISAVNDMMEIVEKGEVTESLMDMLFDKSTEDRVLYMYLVDEITMKPVIPDEDSDDYPYHIEQPGQFVAKALPLIKFGMTALKVYNGAAGIANIFGIPLPKAELGEGVSGKVDSILGHESCGPAFEAALDEMGSLGEGEQPKAKSVRGAGLRELKSFFTTADPDSKFAGLDRMVTKEGLAAWTLKEKIEELKKADGEAASLSETSDKTLKRDDSSLNMADESRSEGDVTLRTATSNTKAVQEPVRDKIVNPLKVTQTHLY